ncbi:hypothetical protein FRC03_007977 [Tulasnella sp. 419]|nr:hypothetical protein FRC03_007977 [Tulasnella sp. 419]
MTSVTPNQQSLDRPSAPTSVPKPGEGIRAISQSPWPAYGLASLFLATAPLSPSKYPKLPPFVHRFGISIILGGAGYVITQDTLNGTGIATAWSLTYLFFNLRSSLRSRSPIAVGLSCATAAVAGLYGTEYFYFTGHDAIEKSRRRPSGAFQV